MRLLSLFFLAASSDCLFPPVRNLFMLNSIDFSFRKSCVSSTISFRSSIAADILVWYDVTSAFPTSLTRTAIVRMNCKNAV